MNQAPYQRELNKMAPLVLARATNLCEARLQKCQGRAQRIPHHRKLRSQGGTNSLANLLAVCWSCHDYIHRNPAWSYDHKFLLHSYDEETLIREQIHDY